MDLIFWMAHWKSLPLGLWGLHHPFQPFCHLACKTSTKNSKQTTIFSWINYFHGPWPLQDRIHTIYHNKFVKIFFFVSSPMTSPFAPNISPKICSFTGFSNVITLALPNGHFRQLLLDLLMTLGTSDPHHLLLNIFFSWLQGTPGSYPSSPSMYGTLSKCRSHCPIPQLSILQWPPTPSLWKPNHHYAL